MKKTSQSHYLFARRVTLLSAMLNFCLGILKLLIGFLGHSQALIADGVHSLSDLITDALVLFAAKAGSQGPDQDHPYGHERIETFVVVLLAMFLIMIGLGIAWEATQMMLAGHPEPRPDRWVLVMAFVSVVVNEFLFRYTLRVGKKIHSNLLIANGWHHRSDAFSSLVVLIGVAGSMLGFDFMDALAAIIVALLIIKMGVKMAWQSAAELVDTGMDEKRTQNLLSLIKAIPGVLAVHQMRSRSLAGKFFIDVHIQVAPMITVSEGHYIGNQVYQKICDAYQDIRDVTVHIDPEDDENESLDIELPDRQAIQRALHEKCVHLSGWQELRVLQLNYLSNKVYVELTLPLTVLKTLTEAKTLVEKYQQAVRGIVYIESINIKFQESI